MPNTFREQAQDRFIRSAAFLKKATTLLQDDLVNRSALADAVSAIKNMLEGYLLLRIPRAPDTAVRQRWQETAASNSMPDLLRACGEAGLELRGLAAEINVLNQKRNQLMHEDPDQRIETQQAHQALDLAFSVQRRIKAAVEGKPVAAELARSAPARIATVMRSAVSGQLGRSGAPHAEATAAVRAEAAPTETTRANRTEVASAADTVRKASNSRKVIPEQAGAPAKTENAASVGDSASEVLDEVESTDDAQDTGGSGDTRLLTALTSATPHRRRGRAGRALARALLLAAVLLLGVVAGAGLMYPVATGHAPGWLGFATQYLPATPTAIPAPTATISLTPSGPFVAGLLIVAPSCASGTAAVTLTNSGAQLLRWSIGSPNDTSVTFGLPGRSTPEPTLSGVLKGGASVTVAVRGVAVGDTLVVVASTGTVQLPAPAC